MLSNIYWTSALGNAKIPSGASLTSTNAQSYAATVLADVIQVQWQATDREIFSLMSERKDKGTSAPKAVTGAGATTVTATPTDISTDLIRSASSAPPSATRVSTPRSSGLSAGSKIALGVSVPLGTLTLLGIGLCLLFRRRKAEHKASSKAVLHTQDPMHLQRQELDVHFHELPTCSSTTETGSSPLSEIGGRALHELQSKDSPRYTQNGSVSEYLSKH